MTPTTNNVEPTTSATERLRALLDERGVEWTEPTDEYWELLGGMPTRNYVTIIGEKCVEEALDGTLVVYRLTPEQAVAATLGLGTCEVECYDDGVDEGMGGEWYFDTPTWYLSCGHEVYGSMRPCYCSTCGRKVVE